MLDGDARIARDHIVREAQVINSPTRDPIARVIAELVSVERNVVTAPVEAEPMPRIRWSDVEGVQELVLIEVLIRNAASPSTQLGSPEPTPLHCIASPENVFHRRIVGEGNADLSAPIDEVVAKHAVPCD